MAAQFAIHGLDLVLVRMRTLAPKLQKTGLRTAMRKGANFVRDAARRGAGTIDDPDTRESIRKNIAVQYSDRQSRREGGVVMRVGVMGGAQDRKGETADNPGGATWYWRLIEFGRSGVAARPFMRPALENNYGQATDIIVTELNTAIDKLVGTSL